MSDRGLLFAAIEEARDCVRQVLFLRLLLLEGVFEEYEWEVVRTGMALGGNENTQQL